MPLNSAKSDRRLVLWATAIMLPIVVALALLSQEQEESTVPSSYSADSHGAKAAYLLLEESGYRVERWEQSPTELPHDPTDVVLVMPLPLNPPTREEKGALQVFVSRGGTVLITGSTVSLFLPEAETEGEPVPSPEGKDYQPQLLTRLTRAGAIKMSPSAYWKSKSATYLAHYADDGRPVVVSYRLGKGEVIWWASSMPLENASIRNAGNLPLLLNSLGADKSRRILWDEYFHGYRQSLGAYMAEPPLKYGFLQCLLLVAAMLLTYSRRSLPIHPAEEKSRLSPLEFVQTLGALYHRARANRAALEVAYTRFRSAAIRHLGTRADISAEDLARSLKARMGYKDESLAGLLRRIEAALALPEPDKEAVLGLAQELNQQMLKMKFVQENSTHAERVPGAAARAK